jgi:hypothetical protein
MMNVLCGKGNAMSRIKELKYDFSFDSFNLNGFFLTDVVLILL